jgi:outer membrane protein assembly factor BamA
VTARGVYAQAGTREEEILRARRKKATMLTPTRPSRGEEKFERFSKNELIGRILGSTIGFGLRLGGLPTGSGFALGPRYFRPDLAGENLVFKAWAVGSVGKFYELATSLGMPHLAHDHITLEVQAARNDSPALEYYGPGPQSQKGGRSSFRRETTDFTVSAGFRPTRRYLSLGFESGATLLNIGPGTRKGVAITDQIYGPAAAPGVNRQTNYARIGPVVTIDGRDLPLDPHKGTFFEARYLFYRGLDLEEFSFQKVTGILEQYVPFFNEKRVIALRARTEWNLTDRRHLVPFYMQATLGGPDDLRGYRRFRFYDDNAMTLNAEYRWEVMPALDMALFGDAGQVFSKRSRFQWKEMRGAAGFGFRIKNRGSVVMRLDTGFSREGFQVWFKFGHAF